MQVESLLAAMLADVQANEEIGKDAGDVCRDEEDDEVVAPFGGEPVLEGVTEAPDPAIFAVDFDDVTSNLWTCSYFPC